MPDCDHTAKYQAADDLFDGWRDDVLSGKPPTMYRVGAGELARLEIGPGLVTLLGGAPGAGKTAFVMQCVVDALRLTPTLRAVVCNVEMSPPVLLDRQLARLSGIELDLIRYRRLTAEHADRIQFGFVQLESFTDRLAFVRPPFDLANVAAVADAFDAGLIVLDYIQRITPPGDHNDKRGSVNATMDYLRQFADAGVAVIVVSAVGRVKDDRGRSSYSGAGMNLASFRESSELEFGCDDAFILHPEAINGEGDTMRLRHLKSRHGAAADVLLRFDRSLQRFDPVGPLDDCADPLFSTAANAGTRPGRRRNGRNGKAATSGKLQAAVRELWDRSTPAEAERPQREADDLDTEGGDDAGST